MITGKYSALKGFSLFFWAIITVLVLAATISTGEGLFIAAGIINFIANSALVAFMYLYWSKSAKVGGSQIVLKWNKTKK